MNHLEPSLLRRWWQLFLAIMAIALSVSLVANPNRGCLARDQLGLEELLDAIRFERMKLRSGIVSGSGDERLDPKLPVEDFSIQAFFSFGENRVRFERRALLPNWREGEKNQIEVLILTVSRPDLTMLFSNRLQRDALYICEPGVTRLERVDGTRGYYDPRCLGLMPLGDLYHSYQFEEVFDRFQDKVASNCRIESYEQGLYVLLSSTKTSRHRVLVDGRQGYGIVKIETLAGYEEDDGRFLTVGEFLGQRRDDGDARAAEMLKRHDSKLDRPESIAIGWEEKEGVWVPSSFKHEVHIQQYARDVDGNLIDGSVQVVTMHHSVSFRWGNVNEPIAPNEFEYQYLPLRRGTPVFDARGPKVELVDIISTGPATPNVVPNAGGRGYLAILGVFILVATLVFFALMRRRPSQNPE